MIPLGYAWLIRTGLSLERKWIDLNSEKRPKAVGCMMALGVVSTFFVFSFISWAFRPVSINGVPSLIKIFYFSLTSSSSQTAASTFDCTYNIYIGNSQKKYKNFLFAHLQAGKKREEKRS